MGKMGIMGRMELMGSEIQKFSSEKNKISSILFKFISEQKFFISELFSRFFQSRNFGMTLLRNRFVHKGQKWDVSCKFAPIYNNRCLSKCSFCNLGIYFA